MPSAVFNPFKIYIDEQVIALPLTRAILNRFPKTPTEVVEDVRSLKKPIDFLGAKKGLLLTRLKADPLKEFHAMTASAGKPYYALNLISNCHLECTYCILQSYLSNNPLITIYTNLDEILERLDEQIQRIPHGSVIGTGKIADSLALDEITEHTKKIIPFFAKQSHAELELKTKSHFIENLKGLPHNGKTVVAWSLNPQNIIQREEYKTASFEDRLNAAQQVVAEGYPVAFHFDPMILHRSWKAHYQACIDHVFQKIPTSAIRWMSIGTLRFPYRQKKMIQTRFPKNTALLNTLISTHHTVLHYPEAQRLELQNFMEQQILQYLPREKFYRCMDLD